MSERLRTPAELTDGLRKLRDHLRAMDSASPEANMMNEAAIYIEGATNSLREHMALCRAMRDAGRALHNAAVAAVGALKPADYKRGVLAIACADWRRSIKEPGHE